MSEHKANVSHVLVPLNNAGGSMMRTLLTLALDGNPVLPGVKKAAGGHLEKTGDHGDAVKAVVVQHVAMAGAQGFLTNLGGIAAAVVGIPANITGNAIVVLRLVGCVAHLRGYSVDDPRVRSAIMLTIVKSDPGFARIAAKGTLPDSPLLVATAPVFNEALDQRISETLSRQLLMSVAGRRAATLLGKRIPILGGGIGAVVDGYSAWQVAHLAQETFLPRRPSSSE